MRTILLLIIPVVFANAADSVKPASPAATAPYKLSELEIEKFKRISLQINALRLQYEASVQPVIGEQQVLIEKVCGAAKLTKEECTINPDAGTVTKTETQAAQTAPAATTEKKK